MSFGLRTQKFPSSSYITFFHFSSLFLKETGLQLPQSWVEYWPYLRLYHYQAPQEC